MSERVGALISQPIFNTHSHCREEVCSLTAQNLSALLSILGLSTEIQVHDLEGTLDHNNILTLKLLEKARHVRFLD